MLTYYTLSLEGGYFTLFIASYNSNIGKVYIQDRFSIFNINYIDIKLHSMKTPFQQVLNTKH